MFVGLVSVEKSIFFKYSDNFVFYVKINDQPKFYKITQL